MEQGSYRARIGQRLVTARFRIRNDGDRDAPGLRDQTAWQLTATVPSETADGRIVAPALRTVTDFDRLGRSAIVTVSFSYPEDAVDLLILAKDNDVFTPIARVVPASQS